MSKNRVVEVVGPAGLRGSVDTGKWPLEGAGGDDARVRVQLEDGGELVVARGALRLLGDGRYALGEEAGMEDRHGRGPVAVVPVVREEVEVTTREVETGGVRVRKVMREREEVVNPPLRHEEVTIDRVAVQREVSGPMPVREEEGVIIVPLVEEVVVVRKAWVLREEIRINKRQFQVQRPRRVTLRTEEAIVERLGSGGEEAQEGGGGESRQDAGDATRGGGVGGGGVGKDVADS